MLQPTLFKELKALIKNQVGSQKLQKWQKHLQERHLLRKVIWWHKMTYKDYLEMILSRNSMH